MKQGHVEGGLVPADMQPLTLGAESVEPETGLDKLQAAKAAYRAQPPWGMEWWEAAKVPAEGGDAGVTWQCMRAVGRKGSGPARPVPLRCTR